MASTRSLEDEVSRYRDAAYDALEQLDWCIGYLFGIKQSAVAGVLARNRRHIRESVMHRPAEPTPAAESDASESKAG